MVHTVGTQYEVQARARPHLCISIGLQRDTSGLTSGAGPQRFWSITGQPHHEVADPNLDDRPRIELAPAGAGPVAVAVEACSCPQRQPRLCTQCVPGLEPLGARLALHPARTS